MRDLDPSILAEITAEVVAAYVTRNHVQPSELPGLISSVHAALVALGAPTPAAEPAPLVPAVPVKKSITDDYIISLEDGRRFKSMRRYLAILGMTPADYRAKWGLPKDYPMVAPSYAVRRSELAKTLGLGRHRSREAAETAPEPAGQPEVAKKKPAGRGNKTA